jgi:ribosomal protein S18 acetylase RimI-like enzyme
MDIQIKEMETEEEIRGKAFVHWRSWHATYPGLVSQDYLEKLTLEKCEEIAFKWPSGLLVAKDGDKVVGFIGCGQSMEEPGDGEIFSLYVLPEYLGMGIGKKLMEAGLEKLKAYSRIHVWLLKDNTRAFRFYEKCGFLADGLEKLSPSVDAIGVRMSKKKRDIADRIE